MSEWIKIDPDGKVVFLPSQPNETLSLDVRFQVYSNRIVKYHDGQWTDKTIVVKKDKW